MYYDPKECGMRISKLRQEFRKTQQQMADELGIKQRTVSDDIKKIRSLVQPLVKDIFNR